MDFPIKNGGSFHSYVNVYQRVHGIFTLGILRCDVSLKQEMKCSVFSRRSAHDLVDVCDTHLFPDLEQKPCNTSKHLYINLWLISMFVSVPSSILYGIPVISFPGSKPWLTAGYSGYGGFLAFSLLHFADCVLRVDAPRGFRPHGAISDR